MKKPLIIIISLIFLLLAGLAAAGYWWLTPRVVSFLPEDSAAMVKNNSPIQVTFSTPMREKDVEKYLVMEPNTTGIYQVIGNTLVFTPSIPWQQDQTVEVKILPGLKSTRGLPVRQGTAWKFTTRHPWLLFLLESDGKSDLYSIDPDGLDVEMVTSEAGSVLDYNATSDFHIYYSLSVPDGGSAIRKLDLNDLSNEVIFNCQEAVCSQVRISPDEHILVFHKTGGKERNEQNLPGLWMLNLEDGQPVGDPVPVGIKDHSTRDPAWSVSGWLAFYDETSAAFQFFYPASGQRVSFSNSTGEAGSWSADGTLYAAPDISFPLVPGNDTEYYSQLLLYNPLTGKTSELTRDNRMEDLLPAFSPKGDQLVFARRFLNQENWTPGRQIWAVNVDGTNPRPLTNSGVDNHLGFSWSPNGELLAYLRFNTASFTGKRELWLMNMLNSSKQKILMDAYNLQWLP